MAHPTHDPADFAQMLQACRRSGVRITDLRRNVLRLVWESGRAMKAYELLEQLANRPGGAQPPTVYRSLHYLVRNGLVHRLESMNAFVRCTLPTQPHASQFLLCAHCGWVVELHLPLVSRELQDAADEHGFHPQHEAVEVIGSCRDCRAADAEGRFLSEPAP